MRIASRDPFYGVGREVPPLGGSRKFTVHVPDVQGLFRNHDVEGCILFACLAQMKAKRRFNYDLDYRKLDLRNEPHLYRVGVGEQGVLLVEPYKSEILPYWRFKTPTEAKKSSQKILSLFRAYKRKGDFVGMDMSRKFIQMGYTRARRYANHSSGRKYDDQGKVLPFQKDEEKAKSAAIFYEVWKRVEKDKVYVRKKAEWKEKYG